MNTDMHDHDTLADFKLTKPALICRWRLSGGYLPLENRHIRSLAARRIKSEGLSRELLAWVKQHLEWTLGPGACEYPDGVLMLVVDERGYAAMSCGPYQEPEAPSKEFILARAKASQDEAGKTGVAPETVWIVKDGIMYYADYTFNTLSASASFIRDLAKTLGMSCSCDEGLLEKLEENTIEYDELFLVSDELGIVIPEGEIYPRGQRMRDSWQTLRKRTAKQ